MALTYRSEKGSALTITELDNNFRYFTGSHAITGSLVVSETIYGNVTGDVTGDLTGSVLGNVTGNLTGIATTALTSSFVSSSFEMLSPDGTRYKFTVSNEGYLLLTGSVV